MAWTRGIVLSFAFVGAVAVLLAFSFVREGVSARPAPSALETRIARSLRDLLIPRTARARSNPLTATPERLSEARHHFVEHCAPCHGRDGRGDTEVGRGLNPRVPDLTLPATQELSDGELFWIIENGIRLTGMPAFGRESAGEEHESGGEEHGWMLVLWVRELPHLPPEHPGAIHHHPE